MKVPEDADRDFTASSLVVKDGEILLMNHSKIGKWIQPGGHVEPSEVPSETARRETREETGVEIEFHEDFIPEETSEKDSYNLPEPFGVNLHKFGEGHWHCDIRFLARVREENQATHSHEHDGLEWFSREELREIENIPESVREAGLDAINYIQGSEQ